MKIEHKNLPFYHIQLEDVFSEYELKEITKKILSFKSNFKPPEETGSSHNSKEFLKKNKGMYLNNLDEKCDVILNNVDNILKEVSKKSNWKNLCFWRLFNSLKWGGDLIQHYENLDYYKPHYDDGIFTLVIWIYDEVKNVSGGDLYFPEYDYLHPCKSNNGIIFFSKELHGVTTLNSVKNSNRYSITTFSPISVGENNSKNRLLLSNRLKSNLNYN
jgi:hypothetical protein